MTASNRSRAEQLAQGRYPVSVTWDEESVAWVAEVTDLPGCIGAGETEDEAIQLARDFSVDWIEDALDKGEPVPKPSVRREASGRFLARVPKSVHAKLQRVAELDDVSCNQLVVSLLSQALAEREIRGEVSRIADAVESFVETARETLGSVTDCVSAISETSALSSETLLGALPGLFELLRVKQAHKVKPSGVRVSYDPTAVWERGLTSRWENPPWDDASDESRALVAEGKRN